jgi:hypothetical protein
MRKPISAVLLVLAAGNALADDQRPPQPLFPAASVWVLIFRLAWPYDTAMVWPRPIGGMIQHGYFASKEDCEDMAESIIESGQRRDCLPMSGAAA